MEDLFAGSELNISRMTDDYSLRDQNEVVVSLQDAKFNLQMQVYELTEELRRVQQVEPLLTQKNAELEGNKVLLVKARQVIQRLQGSTGIATESEKEKTRAAETRMADLERQLAAAQRTIEQQRQDTESNQQEVRRLQEQTHSHELSGTVRELQMETVNKELEVRKNELEDALDEQTTTQAKLILAQDEAKQFQNELSSLRSAKSAQDLRWAEEHARLQARMFEYEQALAAAQSELAANNSQYSQEVSAMQQQILSVRELNGSLELTVEHMQRELDSTKVDMLHRVNMMERAIQEDEATQRQLDMTSAQLRESSSNKAKLEGHGETLQHELGNLEATFQQQLLATEEERLKIQQLETAAATERHESALQLQQSMHNAEMITDKLAQSEEAHAAVSVLHDQVSQELQQEQAVVHEAHAEIENLKDQLTAAAEQVERVSHELQAANQLVAELRGEVQHRVESEARNERRARKQLQQVDEDRNRELQSMHIRLEKAAEREAELRQALTERLTREAQIEEQIKQLKSKVGECEQLIIKQASDLKERSEVHRKTAEALKEVTTERDSLRTKASDACSTIRGWYMRRFDGRYDWNNSRSLNDHVDHLLHHEVELSKDLKNLNEKLETEKIAAAEKLLIEKTHAIEHLARLQTTSEQKLKRQDEQHTLRVDQLKEEASQLLKSKDEKEGQLSTELRNKNVELDELQQLFKSEKAQLAEMHQWIKLVAGNSAERDRQYVQRRISQYQELTVQVGEQLRSFLLSLPSPDTFSAKLHHPFARPSRVGCGLLWSEEEFVSLKEGLLSGLQCVIQLHAATEVKWQAQHDHDQSQHDQLTEQVDSRTRDLHRLEEQVTQLKQAAHQASVVAAEQHAQDLRKAAREAVQQAAARETAREAASMSIPSAISPRGRSISPVHYYPPIEPPIVYEYPPPEYIHMAAPRHPSPEARGMPLEQRLSERSVRTDHVRFADHESHRSERIPRTVSRRSSEAGLHSPGAQRHMAVESSIQVLAAQIGSLKDAFETQHRPPAPAKQQQSAVLDRHIIQSEQEALQLAEVNERLVAQLEQERQAVQAVSHQITRADSQYDALSRELSSMHARPTAPSYSTASAADKAFDRVDVNGDGVVDRQEFVQAFSQAGAHGAGIAGAGFVGGVAADKFRTTGASLQKLRQECADYRRELQRFDTAARGT